MLEALSLDSLHSSCRWHVQTFGSIASTNQVVKDALRAGAEEGFCATALEQTGGYGRQGRAWTSPVGGLYTSFILRPTKPANELSSLSLVISLALYHALRRCVPLQNVAVKWPNDLLVNSNKICGISLEALAGGVCIGIGINVFRPKDASVAPGKYQPAYLFNDDVQDNLSSAQRELMKRLLETMLAEIEAYYDTWLQGGFEACRSEYEVLMAYRNCCATMQTIEGNALIEGVIRGVDSAGNLLLETEQGMVAAASGEVHITELA